MRHDNIPFLLAVLLSVQAVQAASNVSISTSPSSGGAFIGVGGSEIFQPTATTANLNVSDLVNFLNFSENVTVSTTSTGAQVGNIDLFGPLIVTSLSAPVTLSLRAEANIVIKAPINAATNDFNMVFLALGAFAQVPENDLVTGGDIFITAFTADLGALTMRNLTVMTSSDITQDDEVDVQGVASLTSTNGDISLVYGTADITNATLSAGQNIFLEDQGMLNLSNTTAGAAIDIRSTVSVAQCGPVAAVSNIILTAPNIMLNGSMTSSLGSVTFNGATGLASDSTVTSPTGANFNASMTGNGFNLAVIGPAVLNSNATLNAANSHFTFQNSFTITGQELDIKGWNGSTNGGGASRIFAGNSAGGLTAGQLGLVRFINPAGFAAGIYRGVILGTGEIVPTPHATLRVAVSGAKFVLNWPDTSVLQFSTNAAGPYLDVSFAASPYTNNFAKDSNMFFRLR